MKRVPEFLDLRALVGCSRDIRTELEKARYEKKMRFAKARAEQHKTVVLPYPFRRQAL